MNDLLDLLKDIPAGAWVAISEKRHVVLAFGTDAKAVADEAHAKGEDLPLIVRVPEHSMAMFF